MKKNIGFLIISLTLVFGPLSMVHASYETCMAQIIDDRDILVQAQNTQFYNVRTTHLNIRRGNLKSHWLTISDPVARKQANQLTWQTFNTNMAALRASNTNTIQGIWANYFAYKAQCKALAAPGTIDDTDSNSDAQ